MSSCKIVEKRLVEDMQTALAEAEVRGHLRICEQCRALQEELDSLQELSRSLRGRRGAPADFEPRLRARRVQAKVWQRGWKPVVVVLVMGSLSAGIVWLSETGSGVFPGRTALVEESAGQEKELVQELPASTIDAQGVPDPYVEVILDDPSRPGRVLRLPPTIEVRRTLLHDDFYLHHVSH